MTEYFDVVDEDDNVIGRATRKECHSSNRLIHRAVHIFVFNSKNELLLEKRTMTTDLYKGRWIDVAGHLSSGEKYEDAAKRELKEEIGIDIEINDLKHLCDFKKRIKEESENIRFFECSSDGPFRLDENEVQFVRFFPIGKVKKMIKEDPESFTPGTVTALGKYLELRR